jgi:hypothetical protein
MLFDNLPQDVVRNIYSYLKISKKDDRYQILNDHFQRRKACIIQLTDNKPTGIYRYVTKYDQYCYMMDYLPDMFIEYNFYNCRTYINYVARQWFDGWTIPPPVKNVYWYTTNETESNWAPLMFDSASHS